MNNKLHTWKIRKTSNIETYQISNKGILENDLGLAEVITVNW
nr:hypothetical protein [Mycoplasmopsis bovis]